MKPPYLNRPLSPENIPVHLCLSGRIIFLFLSQVHTELVEMLRIKFIGWAEAVPNTARKLTILLLKSISTSTEESSNLNYVKRVRNQK